MNWGPVGTVENRGLEEKEDGGRKESSSRQNIQMWAVAVHKGQCATRDF